MDPSNSRYPNEIARVVVYSPQPILAIGLENLIATDPALELTASCSNVAPLKEHLANAHPDLAVLDLTTEITYATLNELQNLSPKCRLILWTNSIDGEFALKAMMNLGIRGVLSQSLSLEAHRQCLHRVYSGEVWFEKILTDSFLTSPRVWLTPRESQLLTLLSRGFSNKEIALALALREGTVKVYIFHLLRKSGAKDRFHLSLHALENLSMPGILMSDQGGLHSLALNPLCRRPAGRAEEVPGQEAPIVGTIVRKVS